MNRDMPSISASTYGASSNAVNMFAMGQLSQATAAMQKQLEPIQSFKSEFNAQINHLRQAIEETTKMSIPQLRMVQVLIADNNENIPLEQRLLYKGEPKLTDATDQELFFELDVKSMLDVHNAARTKIVDKKVKERTEYLEPVKIRELKMVVVTIAQF